MSFIKQDERVEISLNVNRLMSDVRLKMGAENLRVLANKLGVSAPMLSLMDGGTTPDMETFLRICSVCQLSPGNYFDKETWVKQK